MPSLPRLAHLPHSEPTPRQLTLPLDPWDPPEALPSTTPTPPAIPLTPQQVWATLPPAAQAQLRQTMLRILQEVVHGAPES
jgi:hypothetical protein